MNLIPRILLYWAAGAGLILSVIMSPHFIANPSVKRWRRVMYCTVLGPTAWAVVAVACVIASGMFLISCERLRRAKKAAKPGS